MALRPPDTTENEMVDYSKLPEHLHEGMRNYIEHGAKPGDFLTAFLRNDLMGAMGRADDVNRHRFFDICSFLYNEAPGGCFGSHGRVDEWIEKGGMKGRAA